MEGIRAFSCPSFEAVGALKVEAKCQQYTYQIELKELNRKSSLKRHFQVKIAGKTGKKQTVSVQILGRTHNRWTLEVDGKVEDVFVSQQGKQVLVDWQSRTFAIEIYSFRDRFLHRVGEPEVLGIASIKIQMSGKVVAVLRQQGEPVEAGQGLVVIEAMKMQNELKSPKSGTIATCNVELGDIVKAGDILFEIK